jgi:hypothetical protein
MLFMLVPFCCESTVDTFQILLLLESQSPLQNKAKTVQNCRMHCSRNRGRIKKFYRICHGRSAIRKRRARSRVPKDSDRRVSSVQIQLGIGLLVKERIPISLDCNRESFEAYKAGAPVVSCHP